MPTFLTTVFGIIPEALFFTIFIVIAKDIKEKRIALFTCLALNYWICKVVLHRSFWFYLLYTILMLLILKVLYKDTVIIDIFLFSISSLVLMVVGGLCYLIFRFLNFNYWVLYTINRIFTFVFLFVCKKQIRNLYVEYRKSWNRNKENKFRSISVRNVSLILLNIMLYILNLSVMYLSTL